MTILLNKFPTILLWLQSLKLRTYPNATASAPSAAKPCARIMSRWWAKLRGKPDPNTRIGDEQSAKRKASDPMLYAPSAMHEGDGHIWALQDINFEVKQGEILGIIGKNGAGKSTLLKILSRVTTPTKGQIKIKGWVASLLEVGTGFHLTLTKFATCAVRI